MTDLIPLLAHRLGQKPETLIHNRRFVRIASHYRKQIDRRYMSLNTALDRAYGDICGQNRHENKEQFNEPRWY